MQQPVRSPVGSFPPNGYGLYDMGGNVWQWTCDFFTLRHPDGISQPCCVPHNPRATTPEQGTFAIGQPGANIPRRVMKGGSHLCAPNYCMRYRPAARQAEMVDTSLPGTLASGVSCGRWPDRTASRHFDIHHNGVIGKEIIEICCLVWYFSFAKKVIIVISSLIGRDLP